MAALIESFAPRRVASSFEDWLGLWNPDSLGLSLQTTQPNMPEHVDATFSGFANGLYLRNPIVFACLSLRARLFSEARFQFQQLRNGKPGRLFGTADLGVLERPQPGWTTRDLLQIAILDADLAGAAFLLGRQDRIRRLRPDWMTIAYGSKNSNLGSWDPDAEIIGFGYYPGGINSGTPPETYGPDEIAFFAPHKNPLTRSGVSLLVAALREVMADTASTTHKLNFFQHAATPNLALTFPKEWSKETASQWIELFEQEHRGATNSWKSIYLGNGIEPVKVGLNFAEMDYKKIQGHAETRIAALTGMHPVVAGFSEGLAGSALNEGNYASARRNVGDTTLRPLWGDIASSLETIVPPRPATRLWFDDREIAFLRDDVKDQAEVLQKNATTITGLISQGFEPAAVVDAVVAGDLSRLQNAHTGLVSVQLQPPGTTLAPGSSLPAAAYYTVPGSPVARLSPPQGGSHRSVVEFWTADEPFRVLGTVARGTELPSEHPLVAEFPSLFEPMAKQLAAGPAPIISREEVIAKRHELLTAGKPAGYDTLATELGVSRATVRRRLADEDPPQPLAEAIGALAAAVAVRNDSHSVNVSAPITVHPAEVTVPPTVIEKGAVQVHVEAPTTIEKGALQVAAPQLTVEPSPVTIEKGAVQVEVNAPPTTISPGAIQVDVAAPQVSVEPAQVQIAEGAVKVDVPIQVHSPDIHVAPPNVEVHSPVTVEPAVVEIAEGAVQVNLPAKANKRVERDAKGQIERIVEEE